MCLTVDHGFIRTVPFYLKIAELVCCIAIWIAVGCTLGFPQYGGGGFINFCTTLAFVMTFILFMLYLFGKIQVIPGPWVLIEVITILSSIVQFLICLLVAAISINYGSGAIATAVFCGIEMVIYIVEFFLRFKVMRTTGFRFTAHMKSSAQTETSQNTQNNPSGPYIIGA